MSLGVTYLLLLATLALFLYGLWHAFQGWAQRADAARRLRLARGQPARRPVRTLVDARLRTTRPGRALEARLVAAGIGIGPSNALLVLVGCAVAAYVVGLTVLGRVFAVAAVVGAVLGCLRYVRYRRDRRREEFVAQLPELARVLSNASAAGIALPGAIELAVKELDLPASDVLRRVVEEMRIGQPVDRALANMRGRVPSREVGVLVSTLSIQQRTGGDTVAALREMSHTLEKRKDLRREVASIVAGALTTARAVGVLTIGALLLLNAMDPGVLAQMADTSLGRIALVVGFGLFALAFWLIRRTTRVET